eukprot:TRINITY_DN15007_c0_g1_i1.p1 TRINITY_DN15007_c0_g1~~TRINITY_DN15007_c0_g1_i1.p1  ORF type:complete len:400 (+),score=19.70 TRINITY_DN15007_c0_g1_i1:122-1321(+)
MASTMCVKIGRLGLRTSRLEVNQTWLRRAHTNQQGKENILKSYLQKVLDNPLPIGAGALVVGLVQWRRIRKRNEAQLEHEAPKVLDEKDWQVSCYKTLPLRHFSRLWGFVNDVYLPVWLRSTILGGYARAFGCDLSEAEDEEIKNYANLGQFFRRRLKASVRPISEEVLVSPCDGKVLHFGPVDVPTGLVEQVKGVTYSLNTFLGSYFASSPHTMPLNLEDPEAVVEDEAPRVLHQCILYLAPGDYHGFHSPVDWTIQKRRHFPGELLSVHPRVAGAISKLFQLNERVAYIGKWKHGFFSMTAVGATNVGSIKVPMDEELSTNQWKWEQRTFHQKIFQDVEVKKGEYFGEFNLGSTIVLIFEAPEDFQFDLEAGMPVKVGLPIIKPPVVKEDVTESKSA